MFFIILKNFTSFRRWQVKINLLDFQIYRNISQLLFFICQRVFFLILPWILMKSFKSFILVLLDLLQTFQRKMMNGIHNIAPKQMFSENHYHSLLQKSRKFLWWILQRFFKVHLGFPSGWYRVRLVMTSFCTICISAELNREILLYCIKKDNLFFRNSYNNSINSSLTIRWSNSWINSLTNFVNNI